MSPRSIEFFESGLRESPEFMESFVGSSQVKAIGKKSGRNFDLSVEEVKQIPGLTDLDIPLGRTCPDMELLNMCMVAGITGKCNMAVQPYTGYQLRVDMSEKDVDDGRKAIIYFALPFLYYKRKIRRDLGVDSRNFFEKFFDFFGI